VRAGRDRLGQLDDAALVAAARDGDRAALEVLLRRHHDRIHLLCRRLCTDRGDAEDATQEALVAIVRGLARYDGRATFSTWAHRVATNACLDQLRRRSRRPLPADSSAVDHIDDPAVPGRPAAHGSVPEDGAIAAESRSRLSRALADLPETFRVPVVLRDVADLDYAQIAELLDLPPGTVRSRIARGRARLAAALPELHPVGSAEASGSGNRPALLDVRPVDEP
jgi:RNA polymerase sigma-70 factor, ECF subfamily